MRSVAFQDDGERLVAEQAVLAFRAVREAMGAAAHGRGLAVTEEALMDHGMGVLRAILLEVVGAHPEAQKGGPAPCRVPAAGRRCSRGWRART